MGVRSTIGVERRAPSSMVALAVFPRGVVGVGCTVGLRFVQGYLAHTKTPTPLGPP